MIAPALRKIARALDELAGKLEMEPDYPAAIAADLLHLQERRLGAQREMVEQEIAQC